MEEKMNKDDLAIALADYPGKELRRIVRAARHLRRFMDLTQGDKTAEEEAEETIKELEGENA